jgi:hypothetical protein
MTEANGQGLVALLEAAVYLGTRARDSHLRAVSKEIAADLQDRETRHYLSSAPSVASEKSIADDSKAQDLFKRVESIPALCDGLLVVPQTG